MDKPRSCGCKGCRTCLICEEQHKINTKSFQLSKDNSFVYCPLCDRAYAGWDIDIVVDQHPNHSGKSIDYPGVYIDLNFLTQIEETRLINGIDGIPWDPSQSGRRKQNYGPKCNFKKNKLRLGDFNGFPKFTEFVQEKFDNVSILKGFQTIEQCSLEYRPDRGASIDPHVDDCWIWGERIVTVNLLSDSVLTMTVNTKSDKYNLHCVGDYPRILNENRTFNFSNDCYKVQPMQPDDCYPVVRIPMPRRSVLVLFNSPRYDWEHQVLREDVTSRRICLAYREFTPPYLPFGSKSNEGEAILLKARNFWEHSDN